MSNVSYQSAQAEAIDHLARHQRGPWGNYEAKPRIHLARMEDAGSLLEYGQNSGIDLYNIIDGRSENVIFANEDRDQGDLYGKRRLHPDSGSFGEDITAFMPKQAAISYPHKGPSGEFLPVRAARGSGSLPVVAYGVGKSIGVDEPARPPISIHASGDLYDVSGEDHRRQEVASSGGAITQRDEEQYDAITRTALARTSESDRRVPGGVATPHRSFPVLNGSPQRTLSNTEQGGKKIGADRQEVPAPILSTAVQPSDAGRSASPLPFAETEGLFPIGLPVILSGPLVLRDPAGSAPLAEEGQAAQPSSLALLPDQDDGEGEIYAGPAPGGAPGPAPATADPAPAAKTDGRGTPNSVLKMDVSRKDGPREGSGRVFSFLAASPDSATGQNKIYRGIPTPRLDSVAREDRDISESGRRWWGKDLYAR